MKDKLRELAERWKAEYSGIAGAEIGTVHVTQCTCAAELLAILDAEGDGGAVGYVAPDNKIIFYVSDGWSQEVPPGTDLYTHPARSGVVSDEDVEAALKIWNDAPALGRDEDDAYAMRAALEHFAKGERHER